MQVVARAVLIETQSVALVAAVVEEAANPVEEFTELSNVVVV